MTQKQLGELLGFKGKTSDVRMAQYESEARVTKIDLVKQMSQIFDVNTHALTVLSLESGGWSIVIPIGQEKQNNPPNEDFLRKEKRKCGNTNRC